MRVKKIKTMRMTKQNKLEEKPTENRIADYGTTITTKQWHWPKFASFIENQFKHGGGKYALAGFSDREATDVISQIFGGSDQTEWVLGTMLKYVFRFKNFKREKDLFKIATYCYILWLKMGYHLDSTHDEDVDKDITAQR